MELLHRTISHNSIETDCILRRHVWVGKTRIKIDPQGSVEREVVSGAQVTVGVIWNGAPVVPTGDAGTESIEGGLWNVEDGITGPELLDNGSHSATKLASNCKVCSWGETVFGISVPVFGKAGIIWGVVTSSFSKKLFLQSQESR
jgi:hypothetical protein